MTTFATASAPSQDPQSVPRDRWGRYLIPDWPLQSGEALTEPLEPQTAEVPWTRVSTIAHSLADRYAIGQWQLRMAVRGVAVRPDLYALAASTKVDDRDTLDSIAKQAMDAAASRASANLGTALHSFTDALDSGAEITVPDPWAADVKAYRETVERLGIEILPEYREQRVVIPHPNDERDGTGGTAGTFDRIVRLDGALYIADIKTGRDPLRFGAGEIAIQMALYSRAAAIWDGQRFLPMPPVDRHRGLVIHIPVGQARCDVYAIDLRFGVVGLGLAGTVRSWRKSAQHCFSMVTTEPEPEPEQEKPRQRKCSVCGESGHRAGSAKCQRPAPTERPTEEDGRREGFLAEISSAQTKADLRDIRDRARELGLWSGPVESAAVARLAQIA